MAGRWLAGPCSSRTGQLDCQTARLPRLLEIGHRQTRPGPTTFASAAPALNGPASPRVQHAWLPVLSRPLPIRYYWPDSSCKTRASLGSKRPTGHGVHESPGSPCLGPSGRLLEVALSRPAEYMAGEEEETDGHAG